MHLLAGEDITVTGYFIQLKTDDDKMGSAIRHYWGPH